MTESDGQEEGLLERFKAGDVQALAELFALHRERLWQMIHFRLDERLTAGQGESDVECPAYGRRGRRPNTTTRGQP